jgi:subtilisin family serine protease
VRRLAAGVVILLAASVLTPAGVSVAASSGGPSPAAEPASVPGELLVGYRHGVSDAQRAEARGRANAQLVDRVVKESAGRAAVELVRFSGSDRSEAMRRFTSNPNVDFAEPNWVYTHDVVSTDPYYTNGSLWGMGGGNGSRANEAWAAGNIGSNSVYVGFIDEGYQHTHPDLADNVGTNLGEIPGDGIDNDNNTYVDDVYGWDFDGNNNSVYDGTQDDHGTHVAGTIGADGGNGIGVAGVVWNVRLLSAKFLGRRGGTTANAVKAVDYFTNLKTRSVNPLNVVATNNSWGGGGSSQALYDAIGRANTANILFVAAAGNDGRNNDTTASYPSGYDLPNVIAVAAIESNGALASWSNYGATTVDLGAPGVGIWSTLPVNSYGSYSGTSMATPHVTGAVALYKAQNPTETAAGIKSAILGAAVPTLALAGKTVTGDRLDVSTFGTGATPGTGVPSAPLNLTATGGDQQVVLAWQPPAAAGGSAISSYRIYRAGAFISSVPSGTLTYVDPNLVNGDPYTYTVAAVNGEGEGALSDPASATPSAKTVTVSGGTKKKGVTTVTVIWTGFEGSFVDVHRGGIVTSEPNGVLFTQDWRGSGTVTYEICETGGQTGSADCAVDSTVI